ncbi:protease inhibitor I9 family protein [Paenibacillus tyrfis]|uniref:protease inhibitor I9 family protein n=1 Tax=Paenibacillus tyrfis TaxID=1501230 RepID=UPI00209FE083|nr:protease inhibitor I9 family protein [Paenibacillus tyrfis]MCP1308030.1 protease inhibitor I9 family protein [Paenibacillus tyrfis]
MKKEMAKGLLCMALVGSVLFVATGNTIASANEPVKILPVAPKDEVRIQPVVSKEDQYRALPIKDEDQYHILPIEDEISIMPVEKISKEFLEKVKGASGKIPCIVLLQDSTNDNVYEELEKKIGKFETTSKYDEIGMEGFAAELTKEQILVLKDLDLVSYIESDEVVFGS